MITLLGIMDKLYSDTKALTIVYFVGTGLLLLFIVMLAFSLRKGKETPKKVEPTLDNKDENISLFDNQEPNSKILDEKNDKELVIEEKKQEEIILPTLEKDKIEKEEDISKDSQDETSKDTTESLIEATQKLTITPMIFNNENKKKEENNETQNEEEVIPTEVNIDDNKQSVEKVVEEKNISINTEIPDVDDFVDEIVNKVKDKNQQFSSVFVGDNTSTMKLDTVLENLNVDNDIKDDIIPSSEKTIIKDIENKDTVSNIVNEKPAVSSLDDLKKSLDEKKEEITLKEEELKNKLNSLKNV